MICRYCKLTEHDGHKTKDIANIVEVDRTNLEKTKVELEKGKRKIEGFIDGIDKNRSEVST